jgi:hypothetical protein
LVFVVFILVHCFCLFEFNCLISFRNSKTFSFTIPFLFLMFGTLLREASSRSLVLHPKFFLFAARAIPFGPTSDAQCCLFVAQWPEVRQSSPNSIAKSAGCLYGPSSAAFRPIQAQPLASHGGHGQAAAAAILGVRAKPSRALDPI